jgi:hypothetical protein
MVTDALVALAFLAATIVLFGILVYRELTQAQIYNDGEMIDLEKYLKAHPAQCIRSAQRAALFGGVLGVAAGVGAGLVTHRAIEEPVTAATSTVTAALFLIIWVALCVMVIAKNWRIVALLAAVVFVGTAFSRDREGQRRGFFGGLVSTGVFLALIPVVAILLARPIAALGAEFGSWLGYYVGFLASAAAGVAVALLSGGAAAVFVARIFFLASIWFASPDKSSSGIRVLPLGLHGRVLKEAIELAVSLQEDELPRPTRIQVLTACRVVALEWGALFAVVFAAAAIGTTFGVIGYFVPPIRPVMAVLALLLTIAALPATPFCATRARNWARERWWDRAYPINLGDTKP